MVKTEDNEIVKSNKVFYKNCSKRKQTWIKSLEITKKITYMFLEINKILCESSCKLLLNWKKYF